MATHGTLRVRWAAIGAACAVTLGAGGLLTASAATGSGERATFVAITPCRIMDTRPGADNRGPRTTPLGGGDTHSIAVHGTNGDCTIPADAVAVTLNVTSLNTNADSYLTVFPAGASRPTASSLNWRAGQAPTPNAVIADLPADGRLSFYNLAGNVDVIADVNGYYVDHHHDDRYYTKAEVDTALAGKVSEPSGADVLLVGPSDLSPITNTQLFVKSIFGLTGQANNTCLDAPVHLPDGATITGLTVMALDNSPSAAVQAQLYVDIVGGPAAVEAARAITVGASATEQVITDSTITDPLVDNRTEHYNVLVCLDAGAVFHTARVEYNHP